MHMQNLPIEEYYKHHRKIVMDILQNRNSKVRVACAEDFPDQIYGYSIVEAQPDCTVIHYVYLKHIYRRFHLWRKLLEEIDEAKPIYYTHITHKGQIIAQKKNAIYNPYKLMIDLTEEV